jgi:hypothetical protein
LGWCHLAETNANFSSRNLAVIYQLSILRGFLYIFTIFFNSFLSFFYGFLKIFQEFIKVFCGFFESVLRVFVVFEECFAMMSSSGK